VQVWDGFLQQSSGCVGLATKSLMGGDLKLQLTNGVVYSIIPTIGFLFNMSSKLAFKIFLNKKLYFPFLLWLVDK
jgi:hypothetical protein